MRTAFIRIIAIVIGILLLLYIKVFYGHKAIFNYMLEDDLVKMPIKTQRQEERSTNNLSAHMKKPDKVRNLFHKGQPQLPEEATTNNLTACIEKPDKVRNLFHKGTPIWQDINLNVLYDECMHKQIFIPNNEQGMRYPHQLALYTVVSVLQPTLIVESGVFNGRMSEFIRNFTDAKIVSIDPDCPKLTVPNQQLYCGKTFKDFNALGESWAQIEDKSKVLIIFDDHQNMVRRLEEAHHFGFKHFLIEDNYSPLFGDAFSLKQLFGVIPKSNEIMIKDGFMKTSFKMTYEEFKRKREEVLNKVEIYAEFPPLNRCHAFKFLSTFAEHISSYKMDWFPFGKTERLEELHNNLAPGLGISVPYERDYNTYVWFAHVKLY